MGGGTGFGMHGKSSLEGEHHNGWGLGGGWRASRLNPPPPRTPKNGLILRIALKS